MRCYFRVITLAGVMLITAGSAAQADDPPAKVFIPLSASYKTIRGGTSLPHFFPLRTRPIIGKFMPHGSGAAAHEEEIPVPHDGKPEAMTQEQANQILSLFGGNE